jgi:hypothetical protein
MKYLGGWREFVLYIHNIFFVYYFFLYRIFLPPHMTYFCSTLETVSPQSLFLASIEPDFSFQP